MRKLILLTVTLLSVSMHYAYAQQGSRQISMGAEIAMPVSDSFSYLENPGLGASLKGLYGVSASGYATVTVGYLAFLQESNYGLLASLQSVLVGYRHTFKSIYGEGQAGFTNYRISSDYFTENHGQLAWAVGLGYQLNKIDFGARFQSGHASFKTASFVGFRVGYNFQL